MQVVECFLDFLCATLSPAFYFRPSTFKNNEDIVFNKRKMHRLGETAGLNYLVMNGVSFEEFQQTQIFIKYVGDFMAVYNDLLIALVINSNDFCTLQVRARIDRCAICYDSNTCCARTACGHLVGHQCFLEWFLVNDTCPLCNVNLVGVVHEIKKE